MKKTIKSLFAIAVAAFAFTACSDVPAPYDMPGTGGGEKGSEIYSSANLKTGWTLKAVTADQPWSQGSSYVQATGYQKWDGADTKSNRAVEGWLISPTINTTGYENVKFSFDNTIKYTNNVSGWEAYHKVYATSNYNESDINAATWVALDFTPVSSPYSDWTLYTSGEIQLPASMVGQQAIRIAFWFKAPANASTTWELMNFKVEEGIANNEPEPEPTPTGEYGTADAPITVAKALEVINGLENGGETSEEAYVKGTVVSVDNYNSNYKSITYYISDDGTNTAQLQVYSGKGLDGADFASKDDLKKGAIVVVKGKLKKYVKNDAVTPEINQGSTIVSISNNEGGGETPTPSGDTDGTEAKPYTVADAISAGSGTNVFVKAYIVGWVEGQALTTGAHFNGEATAASNILIADSPDETDVAKCMPIQLPGGSAVRTAVNLVDNPTNYKKEILLVGNIEKYFNVPGLKSTSYAKIGDTEAGTKPSSGGEGGGDTPSGSDILNASFASGQGDFTIDDKELGSLSYVWKADTSKGYMKASAYANSTNNAAESWLISPAFSLKNATAPVMTFNNACNYVKEGTITDHIKVMVFDGANWAEATITGLPDGASWTFVDSTVDLKAYAGKENVKVAFKYVSTTAVAPTWEIKTVSIK